MLMFEDVLNVYSGPAVIIPSHNEVRTYVC